MCSDRALITVSIHAQFMAQTALSNSGRAVGLLRGAGTRIALWFYAMIRLLRVRKALTATIHQQKFADLSVKENVHAAVRDITNEMFWKRTYIHCLVCCFSCPSFASLL